MLRWAAVERHVDLGCASGCSCALSWKNRIRSLLATQRRDKQDRRFNLNWGGVVGRPHTTEVFLGGGSCWPDLC